MTLCTDPHAPEVTVTPPAEIDVATYELLAQRIAHACAQRPDRVVVDFSGVTFCDSTAVSVLLAALERVEAQGCELVVRNPSRALQRVTTLLGLGELLGIPAPRSAAGS